jgi:hypothetical protein
VRFSKDVTEVSIIREIYDWLDLHRPFFGSDMLARSWARLGLGMIISPTEIIFSNVYLIKNTSQLYSTSK